MDVTVPVEVGLNGRTYHIYKSFLKKFSNVFNKAISDRPDGANEPFKLPDIEVGVFNIFLQWMYAGTFPGLGVHGARCNFCKHEDHDQSCDVHAEEEDPPDFSMYDVLIEGDTPQDRAAMERAQSIVQEAKDDSEECPDDPFGCTRECLRRYKCYDLAVKLEAPEFEQCIVKSIFRHFEEAAKHGEQSLLPAVNAITYVYETLPYHNVVIEMMVEAYCIFGYVSVQSSSPVSVQEGVPDDFAQRVASRAEDYPTKEDWSLLNIMHRVAEKIKYHAEVEDLADQLEDVVMEEDEDCKYY